MRWIPVLPLLLAMAMTARAGGINLSWDHCAGDGPFVVNKSFLCDTNSGVEALFASFLLPVPYPHGIQKQEVDFEFQTSHGGTMPPWWDTATLTSCRPGSLVVGFSPPFLLSACHLVTSGVWHTTTLIGNRFRYPTPDHLQVVLTVGASNDPLAAEAEYFSCAVAVSHAQSTGDGACAGCADPVTITLAQLRVVGNGPGAPDLLLTTPVLGNVVHWQSSGPTAAHQRTWNALKQLFR